ncbi:imidazole glycerol phosphate synthase cyclase subunit [Gammaproteobacteria bacterium]|nr:imidazole glycerol phosphate synthase cyclase subunit [Gammaproteobacteria bacterium]
MKKRLIARIDVKNEFAIKGIHLEGLRKVGDPNEMALSYYNGGIDEIVFMDAVAAYYDRNNLSEIIKRATQDIFVPITVGGGIRKISDIEEALNSGADKVAINTQAIKFPEFLKEASRVFGSQAIVASIDAKKIGLNQWVAYIDNGREPTNIDILNWVKAVEDLGAGEIMLTSIDKDGTKKGFDFELNNAVSKIAKVPLIVSGGAGSISDCVTQIQQPGVDALAIASVLHYKITDIKVIKKDISISGVKIRE